MLNPVRSRRPIRPGRRSPQQLSHDPRASCAERTRSAIRVRELAMRARRRFATFAHAISRTMRRAHEKSCRNATPLVSSSVNDTIASVLLPRIYRGGTRRSIRDARRSV